MDASDAWMVEKSPNEKKVIRCFPILRFTPFSLGSLINPPDEFIYPEK
jgi:hypothetical protein